MQDTLLRVIVMALGLLLCPRDDPGVEEEWHNIITVDMKKYEERLWKEEVKLDHETPPVNDKMTHTNSKRLQDMVISVPTEQSQTYQHVTDNQVLDDVIVTKQDSDYEHKLPEVEHFMLKSDQSLQEKTRSESEIAPTTSQTDLEQKRNLHSHMKSKQREESPMDFSFRDPIRPQQQEGKPEMEELSSKEQASLSDVHTETSENQTPRIAADWEEDYIWYMWNIFSIISMIRFFMKYLRKKSPLKLYDARTFPCIASEMPMHDSVTLQSFHSKCVQASNKNMWREEEFLEGFASDMVEAMRVKCDGNIGMVIEDFQMISACEIIVPFTPPEPYSFQGLLWNDQESDLLPDLQVCGQIRLVENRKIQNGCHCQSSHTDEDMVCLLNCKNEKVETKMTVVHNGTPFLSKSHVTRWFERKIRESWAQISHKYDFELSIRYIDAPGALLVRFRSGRKINFTMKPVVKFNTQSYFYISPYSPVTSDTFWTLSLTTYEDQLMECLSRHLPENSCHIQTLEIACFLHKIQTVLSGSSVLKEFHFKTALMHLLLTRDPSQWKSDCVAWRVKDLLVYMEKSIENKLLQHILFGNPLMKKILLLPEEFTQAKPVNLFHPLVVQNCIYRNAVKHFQEMIRNAHMLIEDYISVH